MNDTNNIEPNEPLKTNFAEKFGELFKDEYAVILLQGKNSFGDIIYSYVEVTLPNIKLLYSALNSGEDFTPSDFGKVLEAGKGEPSEELKAEMATRYNMLQPIQPATFQPNKSTQAIPIAKKAWDEY